MKGHIEEVHLFGLNCTMSITVVERGIKGMGKVHGCSQVFIKEGALIKKNWPEFRQYV